MDALRRYDELLSRLLYDRPFRERARAGDWSAFGEEADAFQTVDLERCEALSTAIRDGLVSGQLGGLGLGHVFPETTSAIAGGAPEAVEAFLAASGAAPGFDGTCREAGVSVFESFYRWAEGRLIHQPEALRVAQHELAAGLFRVLAAKPHPGFRIEWPLARPLGQGWLCVLDAARPLYSAWDAPDTPVAYVAALGQYVTGADALDFAAMVLEREGKPPRWASERVAALEPATADELHALLASWDAAA